MHLIGSHSTGRLLLTGCLWSLVFTTMSALPLQEAVEQALMNCDQLASLQSSVEAAHWQTQATARATWPVVKATTGWRHQTELPTMDLNLSDIPPPIGPLMITAPLGVENSYEAALQTSWLAFGGFASTARVNLSNLQLKEQQLILEESRRSIAWQVVRLYRAGQAVQLRLEVLQTGRERALNNLSRLRSLVGNSQAPPLDTLELARLLNQYDRQELQLTTELVNHRYSLELLTGGQFEIDRYEQPPGGRLPELQLAADPGLARLETGLMKLEEQGRILQSTLYPRLLLVAGWQWGRPGLNPVRDEWMDYGMIGATLEWSLWQGGTRRLERQSLNAAQGAQYQRLAGTARQIETAFNQAQENYRALEQEIQLVNRNRELAQRQLTGVETRLQQGDIASIDLRDKLLELTLIETEVKILSLQLAVQKTEIDLLSGLPPAEWSLE